MYMSGFVMMAVIKRKPSDTHLIHKCGKGPEELSCPPRSRRPAEAALGPLAHSGDLLGVGFGPCQGTHLGGDGLSGFGGRSS